MYIYIFLYIYIYIYIFRYISIVMSFGCSGNSWGRFSGSIIFPNLTYRRRWPPADGGGGSPVLSNSAMLPC